MLWLTFNIKSYKSKVGGKNHTKTTVVGVMMVQAHLLFGSKLECYIPMQPSSQLLILLVYTPPFDYYYYSYKPIQPLLFFPFIYTCYVKQIFMCLGSHSCIQILPTDKFYSVNQPKSTVCKVIFLICSSLLYFFHPSSIYIAVSTDGIDCRQCWFIYWQTRGGKGLWRVCVCVISELCMDCLYLLMQ